jgi:uncharacterized protein YqgC (DUF456 family)
MTPWVELTGTTRYTHLWGISFLFNENTLVQKKDSYVVERVYDTIHRDWDNKNSSAGVIAGYVVCVIYCLVITIMWSFRIKIKDTAQSTNAAPMTATFVHVSEKAPTSAVIPDEITLAPAPSAPNEEVISDSQQKKEAIKIIIGNILTLIVGVTMYNVLLSTTVTLFRDSLDIIITSCRPYDGETHFKQISVVNDINTINLRTETTGRLYCSRVSVL